MSTATPEKSGTGGMGNSLVAVNFESSTKDYYYWVSDKWGVQVGDEIVVNSPSSGDTVVRVVATLGQTHSSHKRAVSFFRRAVKKKEPDYAALKDYINAAHEAAEAQLVIDNRSKWPEGMFPNVQKIEKRIIDSMGIPAHLLKPVILPYPTTQNLPRKTDMNITNETFIDGTNVKSFTDDQLFLKIAQAEAEIKTLKEIKNQPEKLKAKIVQMGVDIQNLVKLIDAR